MQTSGVEHGVDHRDRDRFDISKEWLRLLDREDMGDRPAGSIILVLNAGSSSLKVSVFALDNDMPIFEAERSWHDDRSFNHESALASILAQLDCDPGSIVAAGHRVVHGGERYREAVLIDQSVKRGIADLSALAPLHNPPALAVIEAAERAIPDVPQVAVFDTAFHANLSPAQYLYPLPYAWYEDWGVRRFGFHGISHSYCARRAAEMLGRPISELRIVNCHLGAGCSLAAIAQGLSHATTMGFTPLDGLPMATRSGSLDPGILIYLLQTNRLTVDELDSALRLDSGLKGISGVSGDMRQILAAKAGGNDRAAVAYEIFTERVGMGIAAMTAAMGGVDAIVFTAGIGEHSPEVRASVSRPLGWMGVFLDETCNADATPDQDIARSDSGVRILLIHTREDLLIAQEVRRVLQLAPAAK